MRRSGWGTPGSGTASQERSVSFRRRQSSSFAAEHIAQLRQTLDAGAAKKLADLSCLASPDRHVVVPIGYRRTEFQRLKPAPGPTDAGLALKDRAGTLAFDR